METTLTRPTAAPPAAATLLRRALLLDAAASGVLGLLLALAVDPLAGPFDLPPGLLRWAGVALVPFAALLAWLGTRPRTPREAAWAVVAVNALWVAGSALLLLTGAVEPSALGVAFVAVQAFAVAGFAALQEAGLRRSASAAA